MSNSGESDSPPAEPCRDPEAMPRFIYLQMHLLVALFATTAIFGQLITLSATSIVVWRTALAALGGAVMVGLILKRRVLPPAGRILPLLGIGCIVGMHWMCFFGAIKLANISICLAGISTISFFTAFSEPWIERRRIRPLEVALGLVVVFGIVLIAGFERGYIAGLLTALLGAMLASIFPVLNRKFVNQGGVEPLVMVVWEMVGACLICLAFLPILDGPGSYERLVQLRGLDWLWLLLLAWLCTVFAHAFHIRLLRHMNAFTSNLVCNFEPVYGILGAALIFGEHRQMHPGFFVGTATILLANVLHPWTLRRLRK